MKIGLFGGSFNPVHNGHVRLANEFKELLKLEKIIIMPANIPPHKESMDIAPASDRFNMCSLAFSGEKFEISSLEIDRGGKSFTLDTIKSILAANHGAELFLLVGSDMLFYFDKWFKYDEVLELCTLCAVSRTPGESPESMREYARRVLCDKNDKIILANTAPYEITSTEIREALRKHKDISGYVPKKVKEYIERRGLYLD